MHIRCWGSRGSIPISGVPFIKYGGDTTCMEIRSKSGHIIIIDAGTGIRRLGNHLLEEGLHEYHILFTHVHWDHIMGFPFFKPLYVPKSKFYMYRPPYNKFIESMLSYMMKPPYFPVPYGETSAQIFYADHLDNNTPFEEYDQPFDIGSVRVDPIALRHPNTARGYKFTEDGKVFVFLTDNELHYPHPGGLPYPSYVNFCRNADLLIHDADYTPEEYKRVKKWGHSTYLQAVELAIEANVKKLGLFHLNQTRTDDQVDEIVEDCTNIITHRKSSLECTAVASDMEFVL